jgi:anti-sigma28 factor (negative regulator of flagellin synthesis)
MSPTRRLPIKPPKLNNGKRGNGNNIVNGNGNGKGRTGDVVKPIARPREPTAKPVKPGNGSKSGKTGKVLRSQEPKKPNVERILTKKESGKPLTAEQMEALTEHLNRVRRAKESEQRRIAAEKKRQAEAIKKLREQRDLEEATEKDGVYSQSPKRVTNIRPKIGGKYKLDEAVRDILRDFENMSLKPKEKQAYERLSLEEKVDFIYQKVIRESNVADFLASIESVDLAEFAIKREIRAFI